LSKKVDSIVSPQQYQKKVVVSFKRGEPEPTFLLTGLALAACHQTEKFHT